MALDAVISLEQTLNRLQFSLLSPSDDEFVEYAGHAVYDMIIKLSNKYMSYRGRSREKMLDQLKEAARKSEAAIETHVSNQQYLKMVSLQSEEIIQAFNSFKQIAQEIEDLKQSKDLIRKEKGGKASSQEEEEEDDDDDDDSLTTHFAGNRSKNMVGLSDKLFAEIRDGLTHRYSYAFHSIIGMAGIGKTTLAMKILDDPLIRHHFDHCLFLTIGPKYQKKQVLLCILAQLNIEIDHDIHMQSAEELQRKYFPIKATSLLVVVDDVWDSEIILVNFKQIFKYFREIKFLITTRLVDVATSLCQSQSHEIGLLNNEDSWDLLREEVFGEGQVCPYGLEKTGKKIAEICDGLPLVIVTVARLLSKAEKTLEYWNKVAQKENSVFADAYYEISKVLLPSYKHLPLYFKSCFLYLGVFPLNYHIPASTLVKLWYVEGLLWRWHYSSSRTKFILMNLFLHNVIQLRRLDSSSLKFKSCSLHSVFWHFCIKQAAMEKLFHVVDSRELNTIAQDIESQRRLCILKNILFSIEKVRDSIESSSTILRSLLCTGLNHQYPLPVKFGRLRLLRVLNALTIRFFYFPVELLKLLQLRYLAITCNAKLPPSISKLLLLEFLIVHRYLSIKSSEAWSYLPMEIWDMKKLKHLEVMGSDLREPEPDNNSCGDDILLPNLSTLLGVSHRTCTEGILRRIRRLEKFGVQIELPPDTTETLCCFDHLSDMYSIESLKCVIMNPNSMSTVSVAFPPPPLISSWGLRKLSLSGTRYSWEYMRVIGQLPNLRVLKLRGYAFQGPEWKINDGEFRQLRSLLLEDTDLMKVIIDDEYLFGLYSLTIRHCYKLKEIPFINHKRLCYQLNIIEIVDCPLVMACSKKIQEQQLEKGNYAVQVLLHSSWSDAAPKTPPPLNITSCEWLL